MERNAYMIYTVLEPVSQPRLRLAGHRARPERTAAGINWAQGAEVFGK